MQGVGARAQERASEVVRQNEQRLESAFGLLSLVLAILGSTLLFVPDKASPSGQSACWRSTLQGQISLTSQCQIKCVSPVTSGHFRFRPHLHSSVQMFLMLLRAFLLYY